MTKSFFPENRSNMRELNKFIENIGQKSTINTSREVFSVFLRDMGIERFAYVILRLPNSEILHPFVVSDYPQDWQEYYIDKSLENIDPILIQCTKSNIPFTWGIVPSSQHISRGQAKFLNQAKDAGLKNGMTVPIHGYGAEFGLLSVASELRDAEFQDVIRKDLHIIHLAAMYYHESVRRNLITPPNLEEQIRLTSREMECLLWAAKGKTAWETSEILTISKDTANFHIKNAMKKLGVYNKRQAVVKAIVLSLICP